MCMNTSVYPHSSCPWTCGKTNLMGKENPSGEWKERERVTLEDFVQLRHRLSQKYGKEEISPESSGCGRAEAGLGLLEVLLDRENTQLQVYSKGAAHIWKSGGHGYLPVHHSPVWQSQHDSLPHPWCFPGCSKC